jgi:hypothetical protein
MIMIMIMMDEGVRYNREYPPSCSFWLLLFFYWERREIHTRDWMGEYLSHTHYRITKKNCCKKYNTNTTYYMAYKKRTFRGLRIRIFFMYGALFVVGLAAVRNRYYNMQKDG